MAPSHTHDSHDAATGAGFASGLTLALAAIIVAAIIAGIVLLVAQPWDNGGVATPNVPAFDQPGEGGGEGGGDGGDSGAE